MPWGGEDMSLPELEEQRPVRARNPSIAAHAQRGRAISFTSLWRQIGPSAGLSHRSPAIVYDVSYLRSDLSVEPDRNQVFEAGL